MWHIFKFGLFRTWKFQRYRKINTYLSLIDSKDTLKNKLCSIIVEALRVWLHREYEKKIRTEKNKFKHFIYEKEILKRVMQSLSHILFIRSKTNLGTMF